MEIDNRGSLERLLAEVRACQVCAGQLPLGPRPVLRASRSSRILIVGQAPGTKVHASGIPWDDASGDRLRAWMGVDKAVFYDERKIAIIPMGLCYPGRLPRGGDAPPRPECAPLWHAKLLQMMPRLELIILAGQYAHAYYLGDARGKTLVDTVRRYEEFLPDCLPIPHPSPRNNQWLKTNAWFESDVVPVLRARVSTLL